MGRRVWWRQFAHGLYAGNGHLERGWVVCCNLVCSHCLVCNQTLLVCLCLSPRFCIWILFLLSFYIFPLFLRIVLFLFWISLVFGNCRSLSKLCVVLIWWITLIFVDLTVPL